MKVYNHRGYIIMKSDESGKWFAINGNSSFDNEFDSIEKAKNAIDGRLGGYPTRRIPKRWLKDEKLRKEYES
jgi:hypothetical protein